MPRGLVPDEKDLSVGFLKHRFEVLDRKVRSAFLVVLNVGFSRGQVEGPVESPLVVFFWDPDWALLADRLPLPA
jgi:hypothetical protein